LRMPSTNSLKRRIKRGRRSHKPPSGKRKSKSDMRRRRPTSESRRI